MKISNMYFRIACSAFITLFLSFRFQVSAQSIRPNWLHPSTPVPALSEKTSAIQADFPLLCTGFLWDEGITRWDTSGQITFAYSAIGALNERIVSNYSSGIFSMDYRQTYQQDALGNDSIFMQELWNGTAWIPSFRFLNGYDAFGNITLSLGSTWNGASWDTSSGYRATFTYHNSSQIATSIQENYALGVGWEPSYKVEFTFDNQNRWDTATGYSYSAPNWMPDKRQVDVGWHDFSKNQPDSARTETWNGTWSNYERFRVTYGQNDNQVWIYDKFSTAWIPSKKFIFDHDQFGNEVRYEDYDWVGAWLQGDGLLTNYTYAPTGEKNEVWTELFDGYLYRRHDRQVYASFFTEIEPESSKVMKVTLFPNPVTGPADQLQIRVSQDNPSPLKISIFDMQGSLRLETYVQAGVESQVVIPLSEDMENGTYSYRVQSKYGNATGKVILQR